MHPKRFKFISSDAKLITQELVPVIEKVILELMKEQSKLQYKSKAIEKDFEVDNIDILFEETAVSVEKTNLCISLKFPKNWNGVIALCSSPINHRGTMRKHFYNTELSYVELSGDGIYKVLNHDFRLLNFIKSTTER